MVVSGHTGSSAILLEVEGVLHSGEMQPAPPPVPASSAASGKSPGMLETFWSFTFGSYLVIFGLSPFGHITFLVFHLPFSADCTLVLEVGVGYVVLVQIM